jgi:hypothetical protein
VSPNAEPLHTPPYGLKAPEVVAVPAGVET